MKNERKDGIELAFLSASWIFRITKTASQLSGHLHITVKVMLEICEN